SPATACPGRWPPWRWLRSRWASSSRRRRCRSSRKWSEPHCLSRVSTGFSRFHGVCRDGPTMSDDSPPVPLPIEDALDLHPFAPRDIPEVVAAYLEAARDAGLREVRLIHGRGQGVQRARVVSLLARLPGVLQAYEAPPERGGWGATVVVLAERDGTGTTEPA